MLRSLFSGITGLRSHQTMMDVTGNNIANVNTAGFKSSTTLFQDTLSQRCSGAGRAAGPTPAARTPPRSASACRSAAISTNFTQGAAQATGAATDLMI